MNLLQNPVDHYLHLQSLLGRVLDRPDLHQVEEDPDLRDCGHHQLPHLEHQVPRSHHLLKQQNRQILTLI